MKSPAYSRALRQLIQAGREPFHGVAVWLDQSPPKNPLLAALACFPDTDPEELDWSLCRGRDVIVANSDRCDRARLRRLVHAIARTGPRRLQVWQSDGSNPQFLIIGKVDNEVNPYAH